MGNGTDFIERRKHERLKAKERAFAVLKSNFAKLGQIINISKGGLTFSYITNGKKSNGSFEVDIFIDALKSGEDFMLRRLYIYASESEYTRYTSTKEEDWRMTLSEFTFRRLLLA